jgi:tetratricopeptide (TPR) repeat protein
MRRCALEPCGAELTAPVLQCSACARVGYCSRACQLAHWKAGHRNECAQLQQSAATRSTNAGALEPAEMIERMQQLAAARDWKAIVGLRREGLAMARALREERPAEAAVIFSQLGAAFGGMGLFERALEPLEEYQAIVVAAGDKHGEGHACGQLGVTRRSLGQYQLALELHERQLAMAVSVQDRHVECQALGHVGAVHELLGHHERALEIQGRRLALAREVGDRAQERKAHTNLGIVHAALKQFARALECHQLDLTIAHELCDQDAEAMACGHIAGAHDALGDFQKAVEWHERKRKLAKDLGNRTYEAEACCGLGNAFDSLGQHTRAVKYHERDLYLTRKLKDREGEGIACGHLGNTLDAIGEHARALELHEKRLEIALELNDLSAQGMAYGSMGISYRQQGKYERALHYMAQDLDICRALGDRDGEGMACGNMGCTYATQGKYEEAIEFLTKRIEIAREVGDLSGEGRGYGNLANVYCSMGQFARAVELLDKDLDIALRQSDSDAEAKARANLGAACLSLAQRRPANTTEAQEQVHYLQRAREMLEASRALAECNGNELGQKEAYIHLGLAHVLSVEVSNTTRCRPGEIPPPRGGGGRGLNEEQVRGELGAAAQFFSTALALSEKHGDVLVQMEALLQIVRTKYLLGDKQEAMRLLKQYLELSVRVGRNMCGGCGQVRKEGDGEMAMLTCSRCHVMRYCNAEHQKMAWKTGAHTQHKDTCRLLRSWRQYLKGKTSLADTGQDHEDFLRKFCSSVTDKVGLTGDWATGLGDWPVPCEHDCGQGAEIEGKRDAEERVLDCVALAGALPDCHRRGV